jgi:hypothetical protein
LYTSPRGCRATALEEDPTTARNKSAAHVLVQRNGFDNIGYSREVTVFLLDPSLLARLAALALVTMLIVTDVLFGGGSL